MSQIQTIKMPTKEQINERLRIKNRQNIAQVEDDIYNCQISFAKNIFRWLRLTKPHKAQELLRELQTEGG